MQGKHAEIIVDPNRVILRRLNEDGRVLVNGSVVTSDIELHHNDRLVFGSTQRWLFRYPKPISSSSGRSSVDVNSPDITYDFFLQEVATKAGFDMDSPLLGNGGLIR